MKFTQIRICHLAILTDRQNDWTAKREELKFARNARNAGNIVGSLPLGPTGTATTAHQLRMDSSISTNTIGGSQ